MTYEIYVGKLLYFRTCCTETAFKTFRRFTGKGNDVQMRFVRSLK